MVLKHLQALALPPFPCLSAALEMEKFKEQNSEKRALHWTQTCSHPLKVK